MTQVLVDSSIWIDYFKSGDKSEKLDELIDENLVVTNELILSELLPFLRIKKQTKLIGLLKEIKCLPLEISWQEIIEFQFRCLKKGSNGIGIPDLIIAQNAKSNACSVYTLDKHFQFLSPVVKLKLY